MKLIEALRACKTEEDFAKVIAVVRQDVIDSYVSTNLAYYESVEKNEGARRHFQEAYDNTGEPNFGMAMMKLNMKYREPNNWEEIIKKTKGDFEPFKKMFIDKDENGETRAQRMAKDDKLKFPPVERVILGRELMDAECEEDERGATCIKCGRKRCKKIETTFNEDGTLTYEYSCPKCGGKQWVTYKKQGEGKPGYNVTVESVDGGKESGVDE